MSVLRWPLRWCRVARWAGARGDLTRLAVLAEAAATRPMRAFPELRTDRVGITLGLRGSAKRCVPLVARIHTDLWGG